MGTFDFKKEYKELYLPGSEPVLIDIPPMNFVMVDGSGDAGNNPVFERAVELLYGISYSIKMSKMKGKQPEGYFEYAVPPLEGLWWIDGGEFSFEERVNWKWTIMIRQPEFVNADVFSKACSELRKKKPKLEVEAARFESFTEGLCVQIMHTGPYSTEPETMDRIHEFVSRNGLESRLGKDGKHHEIYLSDPRKSKPESMKTVLRHPVTRVDPVIWRCRQYGFE